MVKRKQTDSVHGSCCRMQFDVFGICLFFRCLCLVWFGMFLANTAFTFERCFCWGGVCIPLCFTTCI